MGTTCFRYGNYVLPMCFRYGNYVLPIWELRSDECCRRLSIWELRSDECCRRLSIWELRSDECCRRLSIWELRSDECCRRLSIWETTISQLPPGECWETTTSRLRAMGNNYTTDYHIMSAIEGYRYGKQLLTEAGYRHSVCSQRNRELAS
jgi:hypothetical protein